MSTVIPVTPAIADVYVWKSVQTIASNVAGSNFASDRFQVQSDSWFCLMAFLASTNYDAVAGDLRAVIGAGPAAATQLVSPPVVPNNFEVMVKYNSDTALMGAPMPQAAIASNGYFSGRQLPFPLLFPPMTTFDFDFYNVAPTLLKAADKTTAINLTINFSLLGYFIPQANLENFLLIWPAYAKAANEQGAGWLRNFTAADVPGLA